MYRPDSDQRASRGAIWRATSAHTAFSVLVVVKTPGMMNPTTIRRPVALARAALDLSPRVRTFLARTNP